MCRWPIFGPHSLHSHAVGCYGIIALFLFFKNQNKFTIEMGIKGIRNNTALLIKSSFCVEPETAQRCSNAKLNSSGVYLIVI